MCLYPKLIKNKKYTSTKKNDGNIPAINDERTKYVPVGCGNCMECRKQKARGWQVRLQEDIKTNRNGKFITLTFSDEAIEELDRETNKPPYAVLEGYEKDNAIATIGVRRFLERWRKKYTKSIRHWLVTELGHNGTENIHIHGIIWTDERLEEVERIWNYGWVWKGKRVRDRIVNYVNEQTINYIVKYISKMDEKHPSYKSKVLTTAGIGSNYTKTYNAEKNNFKGTKTDETYRNRQGYKIALPIYWRNKLYTEEEKEKLWIQKIDKEIRYVNKEKISIKGGYEGYDSLLKWHQAINKQLGYGDDTKDWSKQEYEKQRRILMIRKRIASAELKEYVAETAPPAHAKK